MILLRHVNPLGTVDLPLLGRQGDPEDKVDADDQPLEGTDRWGFGCLEPGEEFEVREDQAERLLQQAGNYELADAAAEKERVAAITFARAQLLEENPNQPAHDPDVFARVAHNAKAGVTAPKRPAKKTSEKGD